MTRRPILLASLTLLGALTLAGCPTSSSPSQPPPPDTSLDTPQKILQANGAHPSVQDALFEIAVSSSRSASDRYLALRKLEESNAPNYVAASERLASTKDTSRDSQFLLQNAVACLARSKREDAKAALARVRVSSVEAAIAVGRLERRGS